jgi:hypothetical protein
MTDIPQTYRLKTTLATMKTAKSKNINMCIWQSDIEAVEEALAFIEAMRAKPAFSSNDRGPE